MKILDQMLKKYELNTFEDKKHAIKEIVQEIVLSGLSRSNFFKDAAFYGGTALRIFYQLDRFSEDLDFTLMTNHPNYDIHQYLTFIQKEISSLGLDFQVEEKIKTQQTPIKSAFLKANTKDLFKVFYPNESQDYAMLHADEKIKIKIDIDTLPPEHASTILKYKLLPYPYQVVVYDLPSLFAGKIHAVLHRNWKKRVKGRDLYDFIYFLSLETPVNMKHLHSRLVHSHFIDQEDQLTKEVLIDMLYRKFDDIDFEEAKNDVLPFISDINKLDLWNKDFFKAITLEMKMVV